MKADTIHQTLFGTPWKKCRMSLSSGEVLEIDHPDWILMSPGRVFLIVVLADDSYRVIEPEHIVSINLERQAGVRNRKQSA